MPITKPIRMVLILAAALFGLTVAPPQPHAAVNQGYIAYFNTGCAAATGGVSDPQYLSCGGVAWALSSGGKWKAPFQEDCNAACAKTYTNETQRTKCTNACFRLTL
ncbi:MAG: hypothetical protein M0009_12135 [Deltaproteobacteria bacterium]|nr:hypothetical protein [Deltaproteobacteria bacterium]